MLEKQVLVQDVAVSRKGRLLRKQHKLSETRECTSKSFAHGNLSKIELKSADILTLVLGLVWEIIYKESIPWRSSSSSNACSYFWDWLDCCDGNCKLNNSTGSLYKQKYILLRIRPNYFVRTQRAYCTQKAYWKVPNKTLDGLESFVLKRDVVLIW